MAQINNKVLLNSKDYIALWYYPLNFLLTIRYKIHWNIYTKQHLYCKVHFLVFLINLLSIVSFFEYKFTI